MNVNQGNNDIYERNKNTLHEDDVLFFQVEFLAAYTLIKTQQEIDTFHPYVQKVLITCMGIGLTTPIPGGSLALSIPIMVIGVKHRNKILDILNKSHIRFFS